MKAVDTNQLMRATLKEYATDTDKYSIVPTSGARSMCAFHAIAQFLIATNSLEDETNTLHQRLKDDLNNKIGYLSFDTILRRLKMLDTVVHINLFEDSPPLHHTLNKNI